MPLRLSLNRTVLGLRQRQAARRQEAIGNGQSNDLVVEERTNHHHSKADQL